MLQRGFNTVSLKWLVMENGRCNRSMNLNRRAYLQVVQGGSKRPYGHWNTWSLCSILNRRAYLQVLQGGSKRPYRHWNTWSWCSLKRGDNVRFVCKEQWWRWKRTVYLPNKYFCSLTISISAGKENKQRLQTFSFYTWRFVCCNIHHQKWRLNCYTKILKLERGNGD